MYSVRLIILELKNLLYPRPKNRTYLKLLKVGGQVADDFFGGGHDGAVLAGQVEGGGLLKRRGINLAGSAGDGESRAGQGAGGSVSG